jgi:uncharacterized protein (TIGR01244 family)
MTAPAIRNLTPSLAVCGQLDPSAMAWAAAQGFRSVVNNRPDFEGGPDQPTNAAMETAATDAGLEYRFLPVAPGHQTPEEIEAFAALLDELPAPVLAFCRTGTRSTKLFMAGAGRP